MKIEIVSFVEEDWPEELEPELKALLVEAYGANTDPDDDVEDTDDEEDEAYCIFLARDEAGAIVGNLFAYVRDVTVDGEPLCLGLIGSVATKISHRRQGVASRLVDAAHVYFRTASVEFSVLFAFEPKVYRSSGYALLENEMVYIGDDGERTSKPYPGSMVCALTPSPWPTGLLDLCGPKV